MQKQYSMIVGLAGKKLSGKGTAKQLLVDDYGAHVYVMSDVLVDMLRRIGKTNARENIIKLVGALREQFGEDILAHGLKHSIEESSHDVVVIDGIRKPEEVEVFRTMADFHLIYIDAPASSRYERQLQRGEKHGETDMTFEEFMAQEEAGSEKDIASLQSLADANVENVGSVEEFYAQVQAIMSKWQ